jgi:hypothetical protein
MASPYQLARQGYLQHPLLGACQYQLTEVSDDPDTQVSQVIDLMRGYACEDASSPAITTDAIAAGSNEPIADTWQYLARNGGQRGMQFQRDEDIGSQVDLDRWNPLVETLIRPADQALLSTPVGDCDDFAMYGAAHLLYKEVPCSFVTISADLSTAPAFSHVYLAAYPKRGPYAGLRIPLDLSHGTYPGWEHVERFRIREWPVTRTPMSAFLGYGLLGAGAYLLYRAFAGGVN